jgi:hypothetical protein
LRVTFCKGKCKELRVESRLLSDECFALELLKLGKLEERCGLCGGELIVKWRDTKEQG